MNKKEVMNFLERNKHLIGWGNFEVIIKVPDKWERGSLAQVEPSVIGQQVVLTLPKPFWELNDKKQINILLHEFVHGRVWQKENELEDVVRKFNDYYEEVMVNDITKLMEEWK